MSVYKGICASNGIGIGKAYYLEDKKIITIPQVRIQNSEKQQGWTRFENSLNYIKQVVELKSQCDNKDLQEIAQTYLLMLNDTVFIDEIKNEYNIYSYNIEHIVYKVLNTYAEKLRAIDDDYFKERAFDITDIFTKVIYHMMGFKERDFEDIPAGSIIVANNIQPSDAIEIFKQKISGIVSNEGGINSHLSILARSYNIPFIFGVDVLKILQSEKITKDSFIIIDAEKGQTIFNAQEKQMKEYITLKEEQLLHKKELDKYINKKAITKDNVLFSLMANIGSVEELKNVIEQGADGIGLLRTEFLFMQAQDRNELLSEEEQYNIYSKILSEMGDKPVIIRTLDAGGDKVLQSLELKNEVEANPLLGNRAIRFCLSHEDIFRTQLRALYRASIYGNLKIMIPLISVEEQIIQAKKIIEQVKEELLNENQDIKTDVPVGIMIETPSAAICADRLAKHCDFFSIGTNDLTQYTLAVDRENLLVSNIFDDLNPAVVLLIKHTFECAKKADIDVSVCGELAGQLEGIKILGGIGIRHLSMTATKLCQTKAMLINTSIEDMEKSLSCILS